MSGSGKTVVALMAMLDVVEAGSQAALMAPTEILARQHYATLVSLAEPAGVEVALLTGREKGKTRDNILLRLASGDIGILVGTHALFSEDVAFKDLALAVIDEQHRFGVEQRIALSNKGKGVDILVMTATPIPRTLMLTAYGDLDSSRLTEKPAGRKPRSTRTIPLSRLDEVIEAVRRALKADAKIYWICPLVEESELLDIAAAEERFANLKGLFGERVALVHGKLKGAEKDRVMENFAARPDQPAGRHHGNRSRGRRARCDGDGDRACRAFRPGAASPATRPHRARRQAVDLPAALRDAIDRDGEGAARDPARDRGRVPHRRRGSAPARRRRGARYAAKRHAGTAPGRSRRAWRPGRDRP